MIDPAHARIPHTAANGTTNPNVTADPWAADLSKSDPEARDAREAEANLRRRMAGKPHLELSTMCLPPGVPEILNLRDDMKILQTPKEVVFLYSRDHQSRHVYMNVPHSKNPGHSWLGESVGHYEGGTLVVDTIGENDKTHSDRFGTPHSDRIHVVERYRVTADRKRLEVLATIDDPGAFTREWSARADTGPTTIGSSRKSSAPRTTGRPARITRSRFRSPKRRTSERSSTSADPLREHPFLAARRRKTRMQHAPVGRAVGVDVPEE